MPANCKDCNDYAQMVGVGMLTAARLRAKIAEVAADKDAKLAAAKSAAATEALSLKARLNIARVFLAQLTANGKIKPRRRAEFISRQQATGAKVLKLLEAEPSPAPKAKK